MFALFGLGAAAGTADAAVVGIDYALPEPPVAPRLQPGFVDAQHPDAVSDSVANTVASPFAGGGTLTLTLSNPTGGGNTLDFRTPPDAANRHQVAGTSRNELVEDFAAVRQGRMQVTITGLPAGIYNFISYHNETTNTGFGTGSYDARIVGVTQDSATTAILPATTDDASLSTMNFQFAATAGTPVVIDFISTAPTSGFQPIVLNGYEVSDVPEPAVLGVLCLGGVALFGRRRGRRCD